MKNTVYLKCGFGKEEITPDFPVVMDGFAAREGKSTGTHDPLYLRVIALKDEKENSCLFVILDLIGLNDRLAGEMKQKIQDCFQFPAENIILLCTHTHSGPASGVLHSLEISEAYFAMVYERLLKAVETALGNYEVMYMDVVTGEARMGVNRRCFQDGRIQIGENYDGPRDESLRVLRFMAEGRIKGIWANASCHPVNFEAGNLQISSDYPGVFYGEMEAGKREIFTAFTNSAAGNMNPVLKEGESQEDSLSRNGKELYHAVQKALAGTLATESSAGVLQIKNIQVQIPLKLERNPDIIREKLEFYREKNQNAGKEAEHYVASTYIGWYQRRLAACERQEDDFLNVTIQICSIGRQLFFVALPFEVFVETKQKLLGEMAQLGIAPESVFLCSYANGVKAYLPTPEAVREGGYEVESSYIWYDLPGSYTERSEPAVIAACMEAVEKLISEVG